MIVGRSDQKLRQASRRPVFAFWSLGLSIGLALPALSQNVPAGAATSIERPFGTLREQALEQQRWLEARMATVLPALMRKRSVDMWVVPMREYNEDPVFSSLVSPTTFSARRRTIYLFFDQCAHPERKDARGIVPCRVERIALGGTSQGGVFEAVRSTAPASGPAGTRGAQQAELWGDAQWQVLRRAIEARNPRSIAIDRSRVFAFSDGLSSGELEGMRQALGPKWNARFTDAESLPLELIATRLPAEEVVYERMARVAWQIIETAFSSQVITPGVTRTEDVVWWMRQRVNDLGLGTWFHPSVEVQRKGATEEQLGDNLIIQRGDVLHCDFGITAMRLNTDTQHMGYVLREGETTVPPGLMKALVTSNRLQDILLGELRVGRTGNAVLRAALTKAHAEGIDGTIYSHPIGMNGHGAGPLIGLWDYQDGVPGRGDARVIPSMWFSVELQATTPVAEWGGQRVRSAQEEDVMLGADGAVRWSWKRQVAFHIIE
jgi:hypothetical protein